MTWNVVARAYKRDQKLVPEVALCRGAFGGEGITGDGSYSSLYSGFWCLVLEKSGTLKLGRLIGSSWVEVVPLSVLPVLPKSARHISMAFDQAARPLIAWEVSSQIFVHQWDGNTSQYVTRGPFAGVDPALFMDAQVLKSSVNSDVILFCLNPARDAVKFRLQRDQFGIESNLIAVASNSSLDAVVLEEYRYRLALGNTNNAQSMLVSTTYPIVISLIKTMLASGAWQAGAEFEQIITALGSETMLASGAWTAGAEFEAIILMQPTETMLGTGAWTSGAELEAIRMDFTEAMLGTGAWLAGTANEIILETLLSETLAASGAWIGGVET